jgi:hypothetical protein
MRQDGDWEKLCYTYELPWKEDSHGESLKKKSRVVEGTYEMRVRTDGAKGWRLELLGTGHRENIQVHRSHKSMYIEGCILPVHFNDFNAADDSGLVPVKIKKGDMTIQNHSVALMEKIKERFNVLSAPGLIGMPNLLRKGSPEVTISALLPPYYPIKLKSTESVVV